MLPHVWLCLTNQMFTVIISSFLFFSHCASYEGVRDLPRETELAVKTADLKQSYSITNKKLSVFLENGQWFSSRCTLYLSLIYCTCALLCDREEVFNPHLMSPPCVFDSIFDGQFPLDLSQMIFLW